MGAYLTPAAAKRAYEYEQDAKRAEQSRQKWGRATQRHCGDCSKAGKDPWHRVEAPCEHYRAPVARSKPLYPMVAWNLDSEPILVESAADYKREAAKRGKIVVDLL